MSGASRKVKNPLLSAAGEGFPFDNYAENALLVPVTPATPAVLRDDAELDSFVGQEPVNSYNSTALTDADSEFTPIPLNSDENKNPTSQPPKQGYLTSILSSLPNLSLSSITGDSGAQANRTQEQTGGLQNTNSYVPSHEHRDSLRGTSPPIIANFPDSRRTNLVGSSAEGSAGSLSAPPQVTLPPTIPSSTNGTISYRLGNQRRLKYAPPPDLTSDTSRHYSTPVVQSSFAPQSATTPTIFNPNEIVSTAQSHQPVPSTLSYRPAPLTQSSQSISLTQSYQSTSPTQSYKPISSTQSQKSAPSIQSYQPVPSPQTYQSAPLTQNHQAVPLSQNYQSATAFAPTYQPVLSVQDLSTASVQSYKSVSPIQSNQSVSSTEVQQSNPSDEPVLSEQNNQAVPSVPLTQSFKPVAIPSTRNFQFVPLTEGYQSVPSVQSNESTEDQQSVPLTQSYKPVQLTQGNQPVLPSRTYQPTSSAQSYQFAPLAQSSQPPKTSVPSNLPSVQRSTPELLSESSSQQESFRSSPLTTGVSYSSADNSRRITPQNQNLSNDGVPPSDPTRVSLSSAQPIPSRFPEPITPQNTPANVSFFGFDGYTSKRDRSRTLNAEKESNGGSARVESILKDSVTQSTAEAKPTVTFGPVSAVQVSEKLEHLLAEQQEDLPAKPDRIEAEDQPVAKSDDIREESEFVKQETSESASTPQESNASEKKNDVPQNHGVSSQQYFQTQASDFFADQKSNLNAFPDRSASAFFNTSGVGGSNVDLTSASSRNDLHQVPLVPSSFDNSTVSAPWGNNQASMVETCSSSIQSSQTPLFYNPAQFHDSQKHTSTDHFYGSSTVNQTQAYFDHLSGFGKAQDTPSGISNAFLPASVVMTTIPEPTGSATLSPVQMSINPLAGRNAVDSAPTNFQNLAAGPSDKRMQYRTVYHHWFYRKEVEHKVLWLPFSMQDSLRLEEVHNSTEITPETTVATDGGRYDVDILRRQRSPVYWSGVSTEVRRCSWFYKGPTESRYIPYDESTALKLEEEYKQACLTNNWNRRIDVNNGEYIIFHSATVQVHYLTPSSPELAASWGNSAGAGSRPRVIKRGLDEFHIEDGEPEKVDHLLFLVHGIGSVCDLKFRTVEEVVDEFRSISLQLVQSHYRTASEQRIVNRIEVLPISWHTTLHSEDTGIDKKLQAITLESIPKLRHFTNDTLLDILFYTSPIYCQTIMQTVGSEINRLHTLFKERNPDFNGGIYLGGHSLGSLILFDLLCHQKPLSDDKPNENNGDTNEDQNEETDPSQALPDRVLKRRLSKKISYVMGAAGTGQPYIHYPQLNFYPRAFFALGSPIGMFVTVRGIDMLGEDFILPTCPAFFNIFHPFDPVAYRVEALINPEAHKYRPMLIPHHKGRKRMHLELKETMARVGADLKQKVIDSVRNTWNSVYQLALFHRSDNSALEREIDKVVEEQLQQTSPVTDQQNIDDGGIEFKVGNLNGGRRIDYVLQEAPFEYINEYIFALTSHVCYWESEDTMLMILKEIYGSTGIQTDAQLPQQTLSIERTPPSVPVMSPVTTKCEVKSPITSLGMDPTAPISEKTIIGPPPKAGFVRKS